EVLDNVVERHPEWGISIAEEARSIKVENNLSADAGHGDTGRRVSGGIVCYKAVACSIRHNTVWRNSRGVEIGQSPESALLDNLIVGSTLVGIHWHEAGAVDHNALWGNRLFAQWIEKPVRNLKEMAEVYAWKGPKMAHGLESDPLLEDPENGNFALKPGSPCRGKASDRRDVGADWARLRLVKEGRYERAAPARHHLVLSFERLAMQAADRGDVEGAKALCRRGLAVVPGHKNLEARLEKLGRPGAGPAAQK
ncbi:MAG: hypothetical protein MUC63_09415, partial [Planctomycetes bacterium]|nr:hypothetical protein [Planctomycetota bacterium]